MDHWDQDRRNKVLASRKQQWQIAKQKKEEPHQAGGTRFIGLGTVWKEAALWAVSGWARRAVRTTFQ
eukprot:7977552-Heterocapsa_arctica.AAC.1